MIEQKVIEALLNAGAGSLIALFMMLGVYRIVNGLGARFIEAEQRQAEALGAQAQAMAGLSSSVSEFMSKDNSEHREMLVLLRFIAQQQRDFEEVRIEHETRKKQTHPHCTVRAT